MERYYKSRYKKKQEQSHFLPTKKMNHGPLAVDGDWNRPRIGSIRVGVWNDVEHSTQFCWPELMERALTYRIVTTQRVRTVQSFSNAQDRDAHVQVKASTNVGKKRVLFLKSKKKCWQKNCTGWRRNTERGRPDHRSASRFCSP